MFGLRLASIEHSPYIWQVSLLKIGDFQMMKQARKDIELPSQSGLSAEAGLLAKSGDLEVRLAGGSADILAAQALRYRVFYEEMSAQPSDDMKAAGRDFDRYDAVCDHLLVLDKSVVIGTYRLMRQDAADTVGGYYSSAEYDISRLLEKARSGTKLMELGRSCVDKAYRNTATIQLLWRGIAAYVFHYDVDVMFGCASLEGTDADHLASQLSVLHHERTAPPEWQVRAVDERYVPMNRIAREDLDIKRALVALPPLIKGYLRLGCYIGDGAVIDYQFGTIDVCIILPVSQIPQRFRNRFSEQ